MTPVLYDTPAWHKFSVAAARSEAESICKSVKHWSGQIIDDFIDKRVYIHCVNGTVKSIAYKKVSFLLSAP